MSIGGVVGASSDHFGDLLSTHRSSAAAVHVQEKRQDETAGATGKSE